MALSWLAAIMILVTNVMMHVHAVDVLIVRK